MARFKLFELRLRHSRFCFLHAQPSVEPPNGVIRVRPPFVASEAGERLKRRASFSNIVFRYISTHGAWKNAIVAHTVQYFLESFEICYCDAVHGKEARDSVGATVVLVL